MIKTILISWYVAICRYRINIIKTIQISIKYLVNIFKNDQRMSWENKKLKKKF